jgi:sugar phosphate isomerase/epimerase
MAVVSRRKFIKTSIAGTAFLSTLPGVFAMNQKSNYPLRLGGPVFMDDIEDPDVWVNEHKKWGYSAAYCPLESTAPKEIVQGIKKSAKKSDLIIAEVGAWSNPISPDDQQSKDAIDHCCRQLELADQIGANCCVNIAGSRDPNQWDGPHAENLSPDTFALIVEVTQKIIDTVNPQHTYFTLETMPWIFPNSVESYQKLINAINRERFAVHFDPVNLINSPEKYYNNAHIIKDAFKKLGPYIKSCHGKDTILEPRLTTHLNETDLGKGNLNYAVYLGELSKLKDVPLILEHMEEPEQYRLAIVHLKNVAGKEGLEFMRI